MTLKHVSDIRDFLREENKNNKHYDKKIESHAKKDERVNNLSLRDKMYDEWEAAGGTWWIEGMWNLMDEKNLKKKLKERIIKGP